MTPQELLDHYGKDILTKSLPDLRLVGNICNATYRYDSFERSHLKVRQLLSSLDIPHWMTNDRRLQLLIDLQYAAWHSSKEERARDLLKIASDYGLTISVDFGEFK